MLVIVAAACGDAATNPTGTPTTSTSQGAQTAVLSEVRFAPSILGGTTAEGVVTLSGPAPSSGMVVALASDNMAASVPASVPIASGGTSATFHVTGTIVQKTTAVTITAQAAGVTKSATTRVRFDPAAATPTITEVIGFWNITANRMPITTYEESGFTVSAVAGQWSAPLTYGNPAPFILFSSPPGMTVAGEIRITADGGPLWLTAADLYASTTPIPYVLEGFLDGRSVYDFGSTLGNTFGRFVRVDNPHANVPVDAVVIRLTNQAAPCCENPMGVDTIVVRR